MSAIQIDIPSDRIEAFCRKWKIRELALFGSVLRDDFNDASDIDVVVTFAPGAIPSLLDVMRMERELGKLTGRPVEILTRTGIEQSPNPIRRRAILDGIRTLYEAA